MSNYIPQNTQNTSLYILKVALNWSHLELMGHKLFFLDENQTKMLFTWKDENQNNHKLVTMQLQL